MRLLAFMGCALLLSGPALAQDDGTSDKYDFFSQPGRERALVIADFVECRDLASAVQPPRAGYVYTPNAVAAGAVGFMQGLVRGAQRRHMFDAALRKCMNVKGYARYATTKDEVKVIYSGSWDAMREKLADRALAPVGTARRLDP